MWDNFTIYDLSMMLIILWLSYELGKVKRKTDAHEKEFEEIDAEMRDINRRL